MTCEHIVAYFAIGALMAIGVRLLNDKKIHLGVLVMGAIAWPAAAAAMLIIGVFVLMDIEI